MIQELKSAGLMPYEVAKLLNCGRVSVSHWYHGHHEPHAMIITRLERLSICARHARVAGQLPLKSDVSKADRYPKIQLLLERQRIRHRIGPFLD